MTDTGVVGELRLPPWLVDRWQAAVVRWRASPRLLQVFVALAALDVLARLVGLLGPRINVLDPIETVFSLLYRDLVIAFPAILVWRRRDAPAATPWIVAGAVVLALVTAVGNEFRFLVGATGDAGLVPSLGLAVIASAFTIGGWSAIGWGLRELDPPAPTPYVTGLANLVATLVIAAGLIGLIAGGLAPGGFETPAENQLYIINQLISGLGQAVAWAYVLRAVVRGLDDTTRPRIAIRLGGLAVALAAMSAAFSCLIGLIQVVAAMPVIGFDPIPLLMSLSAAGWGTIDWLGTVGATAVLITAFGFGLGDAFARFALPDSGPMGATSAG